MTEAIAQLMNGLGMQTLFFGGGGLFGGYVIGYAIRKAMKVIAIISGLFMMGVMYLSYRHVVNIDWQQLANETQATIQGAVTQVSTIVNNTSIQLQHHGAAGVTANDALPVSAAAGFIPGVMWGLKPK